jgi:predicted HTH domain antitoxin
MNKEESIDRFQWISKIIESSTNQFHLEGAKRLIELLFELDKDEKQRDDLELLRIQKWNDIHRILQ